MMTAMGEIAYYLHFSGGRDSPWLARPHEEALGSVRRQKEKRENYGPEPLFGFLREGMTEAE